MHTALTDLGIGSGKIGVEETAELILSSRLRYELNVIGRKTLGSLRALLTRFEIWDASGLLTQARSIKTQQEVRALRKANRIARVGLETFERKLKSGLSEIELSCEIEHEIVTRGIMKNHAGNIVACAFVASGPSTAEAYKYVIGNTRRRLRRGDLVMLELDVVADGYCSDTTRTFVVGKPNKKQRFLLEAVLDSEESAISSIRPGVSGRDHSYLEQHDSEAWSLPILGAPARSWNRRSCPRTNSCVAHRIERCFDAWNGSQRRTRHIRKEDWGH